MSTLTEAGPASAAAGAVEMTYREAINAALDDAMAADETVLLMGEDVTDGGVYKTNAGLPEKYGTERVRNTPICENGFVGVALGMSLVGLRPVVEIMYADFLPTAGDAIVNQLPKYRFMSGGQTAVPVTIRSLSGARGRQGTQHSATGESWYMHLPGLRVVTASSPGSAYSLLRAAIDDPNPVLYYEHKGLYGRKGSVERGSVAELGRAAVLRPGRDVTIVATLLMVERSLKAAEALAADGIDAEVIDLRWLRPLDLPTVRSSVDKTGRLVIAEEQVHAAGWGATVVSELTIGGVTWASPPRRVSLPDDVPIPSSPSLEDEMLPLSRRDRGQRPGGPRRMTDADDIGASRGFDRQAPRMERIETIALRDDARAAFLGSANSIDNGCSIATRLATHHGVVSEMSTGEYGQCGPRRTWRPNSTSTAGCSVTTSDGRDFADDPRRPLCVTPGSNSGCRAAGLVAEHDPSIDFD